MNNFRLKKFESLYNDLIKIPHYEKEINKIINYEQTQ